MSHAASNLLCHLVWSTKHRAPFIKKDIKIRFHSYIRTLTEKEGVNVLFINGVEDHIHVLVAMPLTLRIPDVLEKVKPVSTKWFRKTFPERDKFSWQRGYGAFSVGKSNLQGVIKISYKDEYLSFLIEQGTPFDPNFIFD